MNDFDSLFDDFKNKVLLIDIRLSRLLPNDMSQSQFRYFVQNIVEKWDSDELQITVECLLYLHNVYLSQKQRDEFIEVLQNHLPIFQSHFQVAPNEA